jgi:hypothetical protein
VSKKDKRGDRPNVASVRRQFERIAEIASIHIQPTLATEFVRTVFTDHVKEIRFMMRLSDAAVSPGDGELFVCLDGCQDKLAVLASFSSKQVCLPLRGEKVDAAEVQATREKLKLAVKDLYQLPANEKNATNLPSLLSPRLSEKINAAWLALPAEPIVIEIGGEQMLLPAGPKLPVVGDADQVFTNCVIKSLKVDDRAKVEATSSTTGEKQTLTVTLEEDPVSSARFRLFTGTRMRFSMSARAVQTSPADVKYVPTEIRPYGVFADQLAEVMRQANLDGLAPGEEL